MVQSGKNATNGRLAPSPAASALVAVLEAHRPWIDRHELARALAAWTRDYSRPALDELQVYDVAEHLGGLGPAAPSDPDELAAMAYFMLRNVAAGRGAAEYGDGFELVVGLSPRTIRYYRRRYGAAGYDQWLRRLQQDLGIGALAAAGRQPQAARAWLRRHPGEHAKDARPARRKLERG